MLEDKTITLWNLRWMKMEVLSVVALGFLRAGIWKSCMYSFIEWS